MRNGDTPITVPASVAASQVAQKYFLANLREGIRNAVIADGVDWISEGSRRRFIMKRPILGDERRATGPTTRRPLRRREATPNSSVEEHAGSCGKYFVWVTV